MKQLFKSFLPYTILLISVSSILQWCSLPIGNTFLWWLLQSLILFIFYKLKPIKYVIRPIKFFLIYLGFSAIYGAVFMTENYWDWKLLVSNLMIFSLPLSAFVFGSPIYLPKVLKCWLKYAWIILILLMPFLDSDAYGRFLVPFTFLGLFITHLNKKYVILTIVAYLITITFGSASRSDMLKFSVCLILGVSMLFSFLWKNKKVIWGIAVSMIIAPIIFFILGVTGNFNIFNIEEELGLEGKYEMKGSGGEEYSALTDTRTFLYVEELKSAFNNNYIIFGRSIARGYDSLFFGDSIDAEMGTTRDERPACETSILNVFNYFGIVGVIIYFAIFFRASFLAIHRSQNRFIPVLGVYVAFRWLFAWIEDFSKFDLNYLFLWIFIGICYSPVFRNMSNQDFKKWLNRVC
ncbi:hypothetical protein [Xylanibacter rarus]|uniref:hypothetical protein n=1 Tax=Xylanibacter rarus TaxID=1676614 RepID=UPI003AB927CA